MLRKIFSVAVILASLGGLANAQSSQPTTQISTAATLAEFHKTYATDADVRQWLADNPGGRPDFRHSARRRLVTSAAKGGTDQDLLTEIRALFNEEGNLALHIENITHVYTVLTQYRRDGGGLQEAATFSRTWLPQYLATKPGDDWVRNARHTAARAEMYAGNIAEAEAILEGMITDESARAGTYILLSNIAASKQGGTVAAAIAQIDRGLSALTGDADKLQLHTKRMSVLRQDGQSAAAASVAHTFLANSQIPDKILKGADGYRFYQMLLAVTKEAGNAETYQQDVETFFKLFIHGDSTRSGGAKKNLVSLLRDSDDATAKAIIERNTPAILPALISDDVGGQIGRFLPKNDALQVFVLSAQNVAARYKIHRREVTGLTNGAELEAFVKTLTEGGPDKPLVKTNEGTALFNAIADNDAQHKAFWQAMADHNFKSAAMYAFNQARNSTSDDEYTRWIKVVSQVIRVADQSYNARALDFVKWVNGEIAENPVADLITP